MTKNIAGFFPASAFRNVLAGAPVVINIHRLKRRLQPVMCHGLSSPEWPDRPGISVS